MHGWKRIALVLFAGAVGCSTGSAALKTFMKDTEKIAVKVTFPKVAEVWIGGSNQEDAWAQLGTDIAGAMTQAHLQEKVNSALELPKLKGHLETQLKTGLKNLGLKVVGEDACEAMLEVTYTKIGITSYAADMPAYFEMWGSATMTDCATEKGMWARVVHQEAQVTTQAVGGVDDMSKAVAATINFIQLQQTKPKVLAAGLVAVSDDAAADILDALGSESGLKQKAKKKRDGDNETAKATKKVRKKPRAHEDD